MAYFPLFMDLEGKRCLVVGGGKVAARKAEALAGFGASVTVIAERIGGQMEAFGKQEGMLVRRRAVPRDAEGFDLVICASDDHRLHQEIFAFCRQQKIPVNTADDKALCTFYFPALVRRGDVILGISTGGRSPAAAAYLRRQAEGLIPPFFGELVSRLGRLRPYVMERVETQKEREKVFEQLLLRGFMEEGMLTREIAEEMIRGAGREGVLSPEPARQKAVTGKGNTDEA